MSEGHTPMARSREVSASGYNGYLMVVLCGDRETQPIVNTDSLCQ